MKVINVYCKGGFDGDHYYHIFFAEDEQGKLLFEGSGKDNDPKYMQHRNYKGEIDSVVEALKTCVKRGYRNVTVRSKNKCVIHWAKGDWKRNKEYAKEYYENIQQIMKLIKIEFIVWEL